jgi:hypothetical protein
MVARKKHVILLIWIGAPRKGGSDPHGDGRREPGHRHHRPLAATSTAAPQHDAACRMAAASTRSSDPVNGSSRLTKETEMIARAAAVEEWFLVTAGRRSRALRGLDSNVEPPRLRLDEAMKPPRRGGGCSRATRCRSRSSRAGAWASAGRWRGRATQEIAKWAVRVAALAGLEKLGQSLCTQRRCGRSTPANWT